VAALGHRQFNKLRALIPPEDHDDARKLLSWFITAASFDPKGADTPAYREAHAALHGLVAAQDLGNRAARLYHDPKIRAEFGDAAVEAFWRNPDTAYEMLIERGSTGKLPPHLSEALSVIGEVRSFSAEQGIAEPAASSQQERLPVGAAAESEWKSLIAKSAVGRISQAEETRLTRLAEARVAAGDRATAAELAAHAKALGMPARPAGEFQSLIDKSIDDQLSESETARMTQLAGQRAVEQGQITSDQLQEESENG